MKPSPYDSREAFEKAIESLEAFNSLINQRKDAVAGRRETLHEWVVLGRFFFGRLRVKKFVPPIIPAEYFPHFPPVLSGDDYNKFLRKYLYHSGQFPETTDYAHIPPADYPCPECGEFWSISNCHDVIHDSTELRHVGCYKKFQLTKENHFFAHLFAEAGYKMVHLVDTCNPYCDNQLCPPWFDVVADGLKMKIGKWHKTLIIIICEDPRINFLEICQDCDVIKGVDYIHTWGRDMSLTMLKKMHQIISD